MDFEDLGIATALKTEPGVSLRQYSLALVA